MDQLPRVSPEKLKESLRGMADAVPTSFRPAECVVGPGAAEKTTRIDTGLDGVMVPLVTETEKVKRRQKVRQKRRRSGKTRHPLPPRVRRGRRRRQRLGRDSVVHAQARRPRTGLGPPHLVARHPPQPGQKASRRPTAEPRQRAPRHDRLPAVPKPGLANPGTRLRAGSRRIPLQNQHRPLQRPGADHPRQRAGWSAAGTPQPPKPSPPSPPSTTAANGATTDQPPAPQ